VPNLDPGAYPDPFFIFVNQAAPMTWNNFNLTGTFCSVSATGSPDDYLMFVPNPNFTGFLSPWLHNVTSDYRLEWDAEQARRRHAPESPSRLGAVFAFGSYADCERVAQKYTWDLAEVEKFRPVPNQPIEVRQVNMEIVSLMRPAYTLGSWDAQTLDAIWSAYWGGGQTIAVDVPAPPPQLRRQETSDCIWEYLIDGCVEKI
jgi:hypothetical protein